jgi:hypothetical protein
MRDDKPSSETSFGRRLDIGATTTIDSEPTPMSRLREATGTDARVDDLQREVRVLWKALFEGDSDSPGLYRLTVNHGEKLRDIYRRLDTLNIALYLIAGSMVTGSVALLITAVTNALKN